MAAFFKATLQFHLLSASFSEDLLPSAWIPVNFLSILPCPLSPTHFSPSILSVSKKSRVSHFTLIFMTQQKIF